MNRRYWPSWLVKTGMVGESTDSDFERTMAAMAYSYVKDKSPRLMNYAVGFQLLDKNPDHTKAFGTFGFRVNNDWWFVPVIFVNGALKGHEVLYIQSMDFVAPNTEKWINHLLSFGPDATGSVEPRTRSELSIVQPDLFPQMNFKLASAPMNKAAKKAFGGLLDKSWAKRLGGPLDGGLLKELLETNPRTMIKAASEWYLVYPAVKKAFDSLLGESFFPRRLRSLMDSILGETTTLLGPCLSVDDHGLDRDAGHECSCGQSRSAKRPKVVTITLEMRVNKMNEPTVLDEKDLEVGDKIRQQVRELSKQLVEDPDGVVVICDERNGKTAQAYEIQERVKIQNPTRPGVATMFTAPDSLERVVLLMPSTKQTHKNRDPEPSSVVAVALNGSAWAYQPAKKIWTLDCPEINDEFARWFSRLSDSVQTEPESEEHYSGGESSAYLAVSPEGESFGPFVPVERLTETRMVVRFGCNCSCADEMHKSPERSGYYSKMLYPDRSPPLNYVLPAHPSTSFYGDYLCIQIKSPAHSVTKIGEVWHIPASYRFVRLSPSDNHLTCSNGGAPDLRRLLRRYGSNVKLGELSKEAGQLVWKCDDQKVALSRSGMIQHLIQCVDLPESEARTMVRKAADGETVRVLIKESFDPYMQNQIAPPFPQPPVPSAAMGPLGVPAIMGPSPQQVPITSLMSGALPEDPRIPPQLPVPAVMGGPQIVQDAALTGNKDVFSVSMLANLIDSPQAVDEVERSLPVLMNALDKLGRLLLMVYYHQEKFGERYGDQDVPTIESSIRDTFDLLGKLVLYFKERNVQPHSMVDLESGDNKFRFLQ